MKEDKKDIQRAESEHHNLIEELKRQNAHVENLELEVREAKEKYHIELVAAEAEHAAALKGMTDRYNDDVAALKAEKEHSIAEQTAAETKYRQTVDELEQRLKTAAAPASISSSHEDESERRQQIEHAFAENQSKRSVSVDEPSINADEVNQLKAAVQDLTDANKKLGIETDRLRHQLKDRVSEIALLKESKNDTQREDTDHKARIEELKQQHSSRIELLDATCREKDDELRKFREQLEDARAAVNQLKEQIAEKERLSSQHEAALMTTKPTVDLFQQHIVESTQQLESFMASCTNGDQEAVRDEYRKVHMLNLKLREKLIDSQKKHDSALAATLAAFGASNTNFDHLSSSQTHPELQEVHSLRSGHNESAASHEELALREREIAERETACETALQRLAEERLQIQNERARAAKESLRQMELYQASVADLAAATEKAEQRKELLISEIQLLDQAITSRKNDILDLVEETQNQKRIQAETMEQLHLLQVQHQNLQRERARELQEFAVANADLYLLSEDIQRKEKVVAAREALYRRKEAELVHRIRSVSLSHSPNQDFHNRNPVQRGARSTNQSCSNSPDPF